jgi:hypothetical protein
MAASRPPKSVARGHLPNSRDKRVLSSDDVLGYREYMSLVSGPVAGAAARTATAGTARLFAAWSTRSPLPEAADRRCEGVADLAARRASVSQSLFLTDGATAALTGQRDDDADAPEPPGHSEMTYDGANAYIRVGEGWTGFFLGDPGGPRGPNDPLWPLDALFGANGDAAEIGPEAVRGEPATRYRLTVDLARADAALPAGVSVPSGPYRSLRALPAEVWLDAAGLARRISVCSDPAADAQVWSIVELWDFGVAADITAPGPGEVLAPAEAYRLAGEEPPGRDA